MVHGIGLELYKLRSRKDVRLILLVISVFYLVMVGVTAIKLAYFGTKFMVENSFSTLQFIPLIVMVFAADLMSSEFQQGTIKNLIIAAKSRLQIIASKAVALIIVIGLMYLGIFFLDTIVSGALFHEAFQSIIMKDTFLWILGSAFETLLLGSFVFFLSVISKTPAIPVAIGVLVYLMVGLIDGANFSLIAKLSLLKWNIVNMLNFKAQLISHSLQTQTGLSITNFVVGIVVYVALFLVASYLVFKNKSM